MSDSSLSARHITVIHGGRICLDDISLDLEPGDLLSIAGPNGAGKSTLLKTLLGLILPSTGKIFLEGRPLDIVPFPQRGQKIAYLPQERILPYGLTVEDVIALGRLPYREKKTRQQRQLLDKTIHEMNLQNLCSRKVETLSGGEKARICLARALAVESRFLLADEPTASLDPAQALKVMEILQKKALKEQKSICVVLHDLSLIAQYCTKSIFLKQGRLIAIGNMRDVMTKEVLQNVYETDVQMMNHIPVLLRA